MIDDAHNFVMLIHFFFYKLLIQVLDEYTA